MTSGGIWAAVALSTAAGAWAARSVPVLVLGALVLVLLRSRHPWVWCVGALLLSSSLSARAWAGLEHPPEGPIAGRATVLTDPKELGGAVRVELRIDGSRFDAWSRGRGAGTLRGAMVGETLEVAGNASALRGRGVPHQRRRHLVARLEIAEAGPVSPGSPLARVANDIRRTIWRGADALPEVQRGLFGGFVLGDDREQDPATVERFRAAGLTHLLVVSGQNVAFVLVLAAPLVARGPNGARLGWTAVVLLLFGTIVRWEPSVMRAVFMAAMAVGLRTLSGPVERLRLLSAAVTLMLLVDPLLVGSVSFLLSVGASVGIAVLTPWFATRLAGPRPAAEMLATTAGAQVAVAPVLLTVFGSVPLTALPANLLAVPIAGPLMMWGMAAGIPAGLAGGQTAEVLHWPTALMLSWIDGVSRWAGHLPLPPVDGSAALAAVAAAIALAITPRTRRFVLIGGSAVLICTAVVGDRQPPPRQLELAGGSQLWRTGGASILVIDEPDRRVLGDLRDAAVRRIDLLVMTRSGAMSADVAAELQALLQPRHLIVPASSGIPGSVPVTRPSSATAGAMVVELRPTGGRLEVKVSVASPG